MKKNEKTIQKKEKKQFNIYKLFTVLLAAILLVIIGIMLRNWIVERNAEKQYEDLAESVNRLQNQDSDNAITSADDRQNANTEKMEEESQDSQEQEDSAVAGINIPQKQLDWNELAKVNPDLYTGNQSRLSGVTASNGQYLLLELQYEWNQGLSWMYLYRKRK